MADPQSIFPSSAGFDPAADFEAFLAAVPGKWVVYLLADALDQPVQLLCVKNLRASLRRRLGGMEFVGPSKKVNYRDLVRRIYWRRVDSAFEADWIYLEAARQLFPGHYRKLIGFRPAWFVHVDPAARFPRYTRTERPSLDKGLTLGPLEDKAAAARLIQIVEDAFDLCRYYNILTQAPAGKACAYKEMGRCPAPCDGSIPLEQYRGTVAASAEAILDPEPLVIEESQRMQQAAAQLRFEQAARSKSRLELLSQLGAGPFRHCRRLDRFTYAALQRGPRAASAKLFLIDPSGIRHILTLLDRPDAATFDYLREFAAASTPTADPLDPSRLEDLGLLTAHLFSAKSAPGLLAPLDSLTASALARAWEDLRRKPAEEPPAEDDEGIIRQLQSADAV